MLIHKYTNLLQISTETTSQIGISTQDSNTSHHCKLTYWSESIDERYQINQWSLAKLKLKNQNKILVLFSNLKHKQPLSF